MRATATSKPRLVAAAATTLLLVLAAHAPQPAAAHKSKVRNRTCSTLEKTCGFITDGGGGSSDIKAGFAEARFTLTTADDGTVTCDGDCAYDADSTVLVMQTYCPGGSDYTVIQNTCAPLVDDPDNPGTQVLDPRVFAYQNAYFEGAYCTVYSPTLPEPGNSITWVINVYCITGVPDSGLAGGKVAAANKRKVGATLAASTAAGAGAKKSG